MSKGRWSSRRPGSTRTSSGSAAGSWRRPELLEQWHEMRRADEAAFGQPKPLCYSSRRQRSKFNAQLGFLGAPADIILHPADAAAHGIADGQKVRVHNTRGEIILTAKVDAGMRRGVASIPHGHEHANVNRLTSVEDVDPLGGMALYSGVPIAVEPVA